MRSKRRAMAIITVLLLSGIIVTFVLSGLGVAAQHLFQVSALHNRHRALCAAEVGVSQARYRLEQNPAFTGSFTGAVQDGASFQVNVSQIGPRAVVQSQGVASGQSQRLRITLSLDADTYKALSTRGPVKIRTNGYVNGIRALSDTRSSRGNFYTQDDLTVDSGQKMSATGTATVVGTTTGTVEASSTASSGTPSNPSFTKADLLSTTFPASTVPVGGVVTANVEVTGDLEMHDVLHIPAGRTVHVTGDAILQKGVTGEGTLVVDGNALVRGTANLRNDTPKGVLLWSDGDVVLAHPSAYVDSGAPNGWVVDSHPVGDLFAAMPEEVPYLLSQRLPPGAPSDVNFFEWYRDQSASPSPAFTEWKNGDGSELNPGLPPHVIEWLDRAGAMSGAIEAVAP